MGSARFARGLGVRPGEGRLVGGVAALFAIVEAARGFGEVGADALVLARFGPDALPTTLPYLFIALGVVSLVVSLGYALALGRLPRVPVFVGLLVGIGGLLVLQWVALATGLTGLIPVLWLTVFASSAISLTIAWTVAGSAFDTRQAKRLFPLLTGAAIVGSFVGTLAAGPVARVASVESLVVVQGVLLTIAAGLLTRLPSPRRRGSAAIATSSVIADLRAGFDTVARSPLMRLVALAYVLLSVLLFSLSYPFLIAASREFPDKVELATALGLLSTAITATSFVMSVVAANRIYARFGISAGALALPLVYLVGFGGWLVQFSFATAAAFRFAQQVTQRGISNAAWSAFYNVVPADRRAQVLAVNDGVPGQLGTVLSGILLLAAANLPGLEPVFWLGFVTAIVATMVVLGIRRRYADSLLAALRSGLAEQVLEGGPGLPAALDRPDLRTALLSALDAPEPATRRLAVMLLGRVAALRPEERARLDRLVDDPSPSVRAEVAVAVAGDVDDERPSLTIASLLRSSNDDDKVAGLEAAARVPERVASELIRPLVGAAFPPVRAAAIQAQAARMDGEAAAPTAALIRALDDDARIVRAAAASALVDRPGAGPGLVEVLRTGSSRAQDVALVAVAGHAADMRVDLLAWAHGQIERAEGLYRARAAVAALPNRTAEREFLEDVIAQRTRRAEDRSIAALVAVGAPSAGGLMRRSLRSADQDARAQAIEALDTLGDRRLGHALTACLEAAADGSSADPVAMLERLTQDDDPWIAMLSRRVHVATVGTGESEGTMTGHDLVSTELDTMLLLRRIPLFAGLEPEDLQRIAAVVTEREYPRGTALMREGDIGDELVVIVEGAVRIVQAAPDGSERFIRRFGAGDHVGELAVLRDRPRTATVIAEEDVRGLTLGGDGLRAILRERPEAAMAMLATLAERISTQ
jgi:hypothetical protein